MTQVLKAGSRFYWAAPIVSTYALVCLVVMILYSVLPGPIESSLINWFRSPANGAFSYGGIQTYFQLVGHVLGHGSWSHLNGNFIFLMLLGIQVEQHYGSATVFWLICITAITIALVNMTFTSTVVLGASGIVFLFISLSLFADRDAKRVPIEAILVSLYFITREIFGMFGDDNVSQLAHLLGAIIGFGYGFWLQRHPDSHKVVKTI